MKRRPSTPVTLEDLLQFKRAEQPPAQFWSEFEKEMRAKQLAAIVEPRPWWAPLIRVRTKLAYLELPIGAAAILVLSLMTVREYRHPQAGSSPGETLAIQAIPAARSVDESTGHLQLDLDASVNASSSVEREVTMDVASYSPSATETQQPESVQPSGSFLVKTEPTPSARYIAANLAAAQEADPRLMDDVFGQSRRSSSARNEVRDPLAQVNTSGESRRARLLATALPVNLSSGETPVRPIDGVARHLTEERLYDSITRVGVKGDRVAIKF